MKIKKQISLQNPIVRLPKQFLDKVEPDKRKKTIELFFVLSDDKSRITIFK